MPIRGDALFAALLFVAGLLVFTDYVGMDDPQLLAHAVAIGGLALLLRASPVRRTLSLMAALLMTVALLHQAQPDRVARGRDVLARYLTIGARPSALRSAGVAFA